ncbi:MAG: hypothetical protein H7A47_00830 [Verrucomicrobiales bacterium]|nr:hypothetical protein [Verrucomicrobiales bacterium]
MDAQFLFRFVGEVRRECRLSRLANTELRGALAALDPERTAFFVRALLTHATAVSRLLWPDRPAAAPRGETLRQALNVDASSPIRLPGLLKHVFQPDEAFETWLHRLPTPDYLDFNLMPAGTLAGSRQDTFQASLDPDTLEFNLRGDTANLARTSEALLRLENACDLWLRTHNPW